MSLNPICHIVAPVGCMGYGFEEDLTAQELEQLASTGIPTAIILDAGSTDSGPEKLALGSMTCPRSAYVKDLTKLLRLVHTFRVPLIFSSAGGDGADEHVRLMEEIVNEISAAEENQYVSLHAAGNSPKPFGLYLHVQALLVQDHLDLFGNRQVDYPGPPASWPHQWMRDMRPSSNRKGRERLNPGGRANRARAIYRRNGSHPEL